MKTKYIITILFLFINLVGFSQVKTTNKISKTRVINKIKFANKKQIPIFKSVASNYNPLKISTIRKSIQIQKLKKIKVDKFVKFDDILATNRGLNITLSPKKPIHSQASFSADFASWYPTRDIIMLGNTQEIFSRINVKFNQKAGKKYLITIKVEAINNLKIYVSQVEGGRGRNKYTFSLPKREQSDIIGEGDYKPQAVEFIINASNTGSTYFTIGCEGIGRVGCGWNFKSYTIREVNI